MSEWIDNFVGRLRQEIAERQLVIDAFNLPKPKPKRKRSKKAKSTDKQPSAEQRELDVSLRASGVGIRPEERARIISGVNEIAHVTSGGNQDG